jgi:hypothetical protein
VHRRHVADQRIKDRDVRRDRRDRRDQRQQSEVFEHLGQRREMRVCDDAGGFAPKVFVDRDRVALLAAEGLGERDRDRCGESTTEQGTCEHDVEADRR